ncbi:MAG: DUF3791 domain-containing protein [Lachnospiraceae bacterium]|nr:DUF3791 domain-containing protein [Lachnospiraceae bacterium]
MTENYRKKYGLSRQEYLQLDKKYKILNYISECPDVFDSMTEMEMVEEVDQYVSES